MFDNATSHSIYAKDALQVANKNKSSRGQQLFLWTSWYIALNGELIIQDMTTTTINSTIDKSTKVQNEIQAILVKGELCLSEGVQLV